MGSSISAAEETSALQMAAASLCVIVLGWGVAGAAGVHYLRIEGACYIGIGYYLKTKTA